MVLLIPPTTRELEAVARATGFPAVEVEKPARLLTLLDDLAAHPYLGERVALFGGTALNMFLLDVPRLSFDLDLNYIGSADANVMTAEKPRFDAELASLVDAHASTCGGDPDESPTPAANGSCRIKPPGVPDQPSRWT